MNDNENALKDAQEVINNGGRLYLVPRTMSLPPRMGKKTSIPNPCSSLTLRLPSLPAVVAEKALPLVYADNVKDWNNLVLTKDFLDLLGEDPDDVRHASMPLTSKTGRGYPSNRFDRTSFISDRSLPEGQEMY